MIYRLTVALEIPFSISVGDNSMQYHIFEIDPFQQLNCLGAVSSYREAKDRVKLLRSTPGLIAGTTYRMMFATNPVEAERLLKEKREPRPMGEHD